MASTLHRALGDLDVTYGATVLSNDGRGRFSIALLPRVPQPMPGRSATTTPGLAWISFDLDLDGDLDALGLLSGF